MQFYKIKDAGHFPYMEQPEIYWYIVSTFLDGGNLRYNTKAKNWSD